MFITLAVVVENGMQTFMTFTQTFMTFTQLTSSVALRAAASSALILEHSTRTTSSACGVRSAGGASRTEEKSSYIVDWLELAARGTSWYESVDI